MFMVSSLPDIENTDDNNNTVLNLKHNLENQTGSQFLANKTKYEKQKCDLLPIFRIEFPFLFLWAYGYALQTFKAVLYFLKLIFK